MAVTCLENLIKAHEGLSLAPYRDAKGLLTVGYGHLLERSITKDEAEAFFDNDLDEAVDTAQRFVGFRLHEFSDVRKSVVIDMAFNLGNRLFYFERLQQALGRHDYQTAALEILDSDAARELPKRYNELATMMRTDQWPA